MLKWLGKTSMEGGIEPKFYFMDLFILTLLSLFCFEFFLLLFKDSCLHIPPTTLPHLSQNFKDVSWQARVSVQLTALQSVGTARLKALGVCKGCSCSYNSKEARVVELEWLRTVGISKVKEVEEAFWKVHHLTEILKRSTLATFLRICWGRDGR